MALTRILHLIRMNLALLLSLVAALSGPSRAEEFTYALRPGDVLQLTLLTAPPTDYRVPVETDGTAWFPMIGEIDVAGLELSHLRAHVSELFSAASITLETGNSVQLLRPHQIFLQIAEYQPIYMSGDIIKPLVIDFRPGMTLRQALTLAGVNDARSTTEFALREKEAAQVLDLIQIEARIWSTRSLLGLSTPPEPELSAGTEDAARAEEIVKIEKHRIADFTAERKRAILALDEAIAQAGRRLQVLIAQRESELEAKGLDDEILESFRNLSERGLTPASRLAEVRRSALASATRVLQLEVAIENARGDLTELKSEKKSKEFEGKDELWSELRDLIVQLYERRAELEALRAAARVQPLDTTVVATITSRIDNMSKSVVVTEATYALRPGDVIVISTTGKDRFQEALTLSAN